MTTHDPSQDTPHSYRYLHLASEELEHLSPDQLLQACLEYRNLLQVITGILATPGIILSVRIAATDLVHNRKNKIRNSSPAEKTFMDIDYSCTHLSSAVAR